MLMLSNLFFFSLARQKCCCISILSKTYVFSLNPKTKNAKFDKPCNELITVDLASIDVMLVV